MKKMIIVFSRVAVFIITVIFVSSCTMRAGEPITRKQFVPANDRVANGEKVFMANCEKCHPGGEGGLAPAILANPAPQLVKRFQMRHGLGVMPSFKQNEISTKDLHDISKYLKAWKHYK
jgi:mono/diheme cytochrome c family protein